MTYTVDHIPRSTPHNRRPGFKLEATTITIHNTGNPTSSAKGERNWLTNPANTRTASYHVVVDEHGAIECLPLDEAGWDAGDGSGLASGNRTSIGVEICESGDYTKALDNAAELVAKMLRERGWAVDRLRRHYDWSGKICPRLMYDEGKWTGWAEFKNRVREELSMREEIDALKKQLERVPAPAWFVKEFGSADLGGQIHEPQFTMGEWRVLAIALRTREYFS